MNKSPTHRILVGNQRERATLGRGFLSFFFVYLVTILYCSDIVWPKDLFGCFFSFLPIFDRELCLFFFFVSSPFLGLGIFLLFVFSSEGKDYGELGFWLKACRTAGHDICQGLASGSGIKGMSYIISMIHMQQ